MNIKDLKNSNFLTKEDVEPPVLVTIKGYKQENMARDGEPERLKWVLDLHEFEKPMALNMTNGLILESITGSPEADDWIGKQVMLYNDPTIMYQGKLTGGIRIRAVQTQADRVNPGYVGGPLDAPSGPEPPAKDTTDHNKDKDEQIPF